MRETGVTAIDLKKVNRSRVYQNIYQRQATSKQQIVQDLQMGLSTVTTNLTLLEEEGLIERNGFFASTGGRKAHAIRIVQDFRISVGVGIQKEMYHVTAVDLYGNAIYTETVDTPYRDEPGYYKQVADSVLEYAEREGYAQEKILGVSIATQGITSPDHRGVTYGKILDNTGMQAEDFSAALPWPCSLEHDSRSAAALELWNHPDLDSAIVILLNQNLGGAVITGHQIHQGSDMHSGTIEHICVDPDGPLCYCGKRGCLETYCSADALRNEAGMGIREFFAALGRTKKGQSGTQDKCADRLQNEEQSTSKNGSADQLQYEEQSGKKDRNAGDRTKTETSARCRQIWEEYLDHLAFAMRNLNMVVDAPFILSGYLTPYIRAEDIEYLSRKISKASPFPLDGGRILVGVHGQYTPAIGAALYYIRRFLRSV